MARSSWRGRPTHLDGRGVVDGARRDRCGAAVRAATARARSPRPHRLLRLGRGEVAGQLDQLTEQGRELVDVLEHVADHLASLGLGQPLDLAEQLDVAAQARERRAHLVAGVGHEPALLLLRPADLGHHRREARRQARRPRPGPRRRSASTGRASWRSGGWCRAAARSGARAGWRPPTREPAATAVAMPTRAASCRRRRLSSVVGLRQAAGDLQRAAVVPRRAQEPVATAVDVDRAQLDGAGRERPILSRRRAASARRRCTT